MKKRVRVEETNERYGNQVKGAFEFLDKHDDGKRMPPSKIAQVIVHLCEVIKFVQSWYGNLWNR